jgi:hypothetical protein
MYSIQNSVIMFGIDFQQVGGFLRFLTTNKTERNSKHEILLKMTKW